MDMGVSTVEKVLPMPSETLFLFIFGCDHDD